jgi:hypothetical protein
VRRSNGRGGQGTAAAGYTATDGAPAHRRRRGRAETDCQAGRLGARGGALDLGAGIGNHQVIGEVEVASIRERRWERERE